MSAWRYFVVAIGVCLFTTPALAQWANGSALWPSTPVAIGEQAHPSIAFGVRQFTVSTLTGPGQRGISSEPLFNSQAEVYVAGIHSMISFAPGNYTVPDAFRIRATDETPLPSGVHIRDLYGLKIYDVIQGQRANYAIWTGAGQVSVGDNVVIRQGALYAVGAPGYRSVVVQNGSIVSVYNAQGVEMGRIQATADGMMLTAIEGDVAVNGPVRLTALAGSGTRYVTVDSGGTLHATP